MAETAAHLIDEKAGPAAVALAIGKSAGAVRVWKHRGVIPRDAWPELITTFADVTLDRLIAIERAQASLASADEPLLPSEPTRVSA